MFKKIFSWLLTFIMVFSLSATIPQMVAAGIPTGAVFTDDDLDHVYFKGDSLSFNLSGLPVGAIPSGTSLRVSLGIVDASSNFSDFTLFNTLSNGMGDGTGFYAERVLQADGTLASDISGTIVSTPTPTLGIIAVKLYMEVSPNTWQNVMQAQTPDYIPLIDGSNPATVGLDGILELPDGVTSNPILGAGEQNVEDLRNLNISFSKTIAAGITGSITFADLDLFANTTDLADLEDGLIMSEVAIPELGTLAQYTIGLDETNLNYLASLGATVSVSSDSFDGYDTSDFEAVAADVAGGLVSNLSYDDDSNTVSFEVNHFSSYTLSVMNIPYVCKIGETEYVELSDALDEVTSGQAIKLLTDVTYSDRIWVGSSYCPSLTLDLNGYKLQISNVEIPIAAIDGYSLDVTDDSVSGGGILDLNTTSEDSAPTGVTAVGTGSIVSIGSEVETIIRSTADNGKGVSAYYGGSVEIGNASITVPISGSSTGVYADGVGNSISVTGDVNGGWIGAYTAGGTVSIVGDVSTGYEGSGSGVRAYGGTISVTGNVSSTGGGNYGAYADNEGIINVTGNVTSGSVGVAAYNASEITIDGVISYSVAYIEIGSYANYLNEGNYEVPTTKDGYRTYTDGLNLIWVKIQAPYATDVIISGSAFVGTTLTGEYSFNGATESGTTFRWLKNTGNPELIANINSISGVSNNPPNPSVITLSEEKLITYINTYHYFNGGQLPGTIALQEVGGDETVYGPWIAIGTQGQGGVDNAYWNVYPNVTLPAGSYQVVDSDPGTWSWASDTGGRGIVFVYGNPTYGDDYTPIGNATEQNYTLVSSDGGCMIKFEVTVQDSDGIWGNAVTSGAIGPVASESILSADATLANLSVTGVTLTPTFSSNITSYSAGVPYSVSEVTINAEPNTSNAAVSIGGTNGTTKDVVLSVGSNVIEVVVTAGDGTTIETYTINISRAAASSGGGQNIGASSEQKVTITTPEGDNGVVGTLTISEDLEQITIGGTQFGQLAKTNRGVLIPAPAAMVIFDGKAVDTINRASSTGDVVLTVEKIDPSDLTPEQQNRVLDRPVFDFTITKGGKQVSSFGGGHATISIPYTLRSGEHPQAIVIYYLADDGSLKTIRGYYDAKTKTVVFRTTHFSQFVIGHNPVTFSDVASIAWYREAVEFIAARGITIGTGVDTFGPNDMLTRGQFLVLLMKAYEITPDAAPIGIVNFADAGDSYYADYLLAAKRLGIVEGIGDNLFGPNQAITRQELFVMLFNALKTIDEVPTAVSSKQLSDFSDAIQLASWAEEAVNKLIGGGIVSGIDDKLAPVAYATRAQIAQILFILLSK